MSDNKTVSIALIFGVVIGLLFVFIFGWTGGYRSGTHDIKKEAVSKQHALWIPDVDGTTVFQWKPLMEPDRKGACKMDRTIGTCGKCGGAVTVPAIWMGIHPPTPKCVVCGSVPKECHGPVLPMQETQPKFHPESGDWK